MMMKKLFLIVLAFAIILLLQDFAEASSANIPVDNVDGALTTSKKHHHHHHQQQHPPPRKINCNYACAKRCMKSSRKKVCHRACKTCCFRCNCVPPGTYGNHNACPCYANLKTHGNKPKCP